MIKKLRGEIGADNRFVGSFFLIEILVILGQFYFLITDMFFMSCLTWTNSCKSENRCLSVDVQQNVDELRRFREKKNQHLFHTSWGL